MGQQQKKSKMSAKYTNQVDLEENDSDSAEKNCIVKLSTHDDPFSPREGKTLTFRNVSMTLVRTKYSCSIHSFIHSYANKQTNEQTNKQTNKQTKKNVSAYVVILNFFFFFLWEC